MHIPGNRNHENSLTRMMGIVLVATSYIFIAWLVCYAVLVMINHFNHTTWIRAFL
jgi:hypothetical protein